MLFRKKNEQRENALPKYLESWGELVAFARFSKIVALTALFMAFIVLFWALRVINRPPMVIRIDSAGNPSITDFKHNQNITPQEIQNFVTYFVEYYTGWDYYTYDEVSSRAVRMMTNSMLQTARTYHDRNGVAAQIRAQKIKRKVRVSEVNIKAVDKRSVTVEVRGTRSEGFYDREDKKEVIFSIDLNIVIVPRTQSLWGMLVDSFEEHIYNE